MFKRILLPIDGSATSLQAASTGIALAAASGAKAAGLEVPGPLASVDVAADALLHDGSSCGSGAIRNAREDLAQVRLMARDAGVEFKDGYVFDRRPCVAIMSAAERANCDLIVASVHRYAGSRGGRLSPQIVRLIAGCSIPVLVCP